MSRLPAALFIVDVKREAIAIAEAKKLGIPTFAMVDTNADPELVDFAIPSNDDASKSITIILDSVNLGVKEGLADRKKEKEVQAAAKKDEEATKEAVKAEKEAEKEAAKAAAKVEKTVAKAEKVEVKEEKAEKAE